MRHRPGSGSSREPDGVEVLLVDADDLEEAPPGHGAVPRGPADPVLKRAGRRRMVRWVAGGVVLLTAVALANLVEADQRAARAATLAEVPGFLNPVPEPLAELWRVPGRPVTTDAALLVSDPADSSLRGVDPSSGAVLWAAGAQVGRAAALGYCFVVDETLSPWSAGRGASDGDGGPAALVACVGDPPGGVLSGRTATAEVAVVIVDARTGETVQSFAGEGSLITAEPVGRDLLLALALPDGRLRVLRWDPASGDTRWDYLSPHAIFAQDPLMVESIERRGDALTIVAVGVVALDLTTGQEVDWRTTIDLPATYELLDLPGGAEAWWTWDSGTSSGVGEVTVDDGATSYPLPGPPLHPAVHDGSVPQVLVVMTADRTRLRALDLGTGRWLWSEPMSGDYALPVLQSDGVLVVNHGATVAAIDVRSGVELWTAPVDVQLTYGTALSDGDLVLLAERDDDGVPHLVARQVSDGVEVWRTGLPRDTFSLLLADRHVVLSTQDAVVGLG